LFDFEGDPRPAGDGFDIGADEQLLDADGDGVGDDVDCAPGNPGVWATPGPASGLTLAGGSPTALVWSAPAEPGGSGPLMYDVLRATTAAGFAAATCIGTDLGAPQHADAPTPSPIFFYLVRAENACGGNLGAGSDGVPRSAPSCP
jgi:hypothetical protein